MIIYSFCNLNDVSWGTREASSKKDGGKGGSAFDQLLRGCGRDEKVGAFGIWAPT